MDREQKLVWKYDRTRFSYLRESRITMSRHDGVPAGWFGEEVGYVSSLVDLPLSSRTWRQGKTPAVLIVGYSVAEKVPGRRAYTRRYWWLKSHDRDVDPGGSYRTGFPAEAVDPASIKVNEASRPLA